MIIKRNAHITAAVATSSPFLGIIHRLGNAEALAGRYAPGVEMPRPIEAERATVPSSSGARVSGLAAGITCH